MGQIRFLLIEVLPAALLMMPLLWLRCRRNRAKFYSYACFSLYLCAVYALTGLPTVLFLRFEPVFSLIPFAGITADLKNALLNVLLFFPLGFLLPLLWRRFQNIRKALWFGLAMTIIIELLQIFTFRATDINDVITNFLGTVLGFLTADFLRKRRPVPAGNPPRDLVFLFASAAAVMFFVQPLLSAAIWKYIL